jgi:hypothetical protein
MGDRSPWELKEAENWTASDFWYWVHELCDIDSRLYCSCPPALRAVVVRVIEHQAHRFLENNPLPESE